MTSLFLIPMAGNSSRFFDAGYDVPKYMLQRKDKSLFAYSVNSFRKYFHTDLFVFVIRRDHDSEAFLRAEVKKLGIINYRIFSVDGVTRGQAESVYLALLNDQENIEEELYIFNIDTVRPNFKKPSFDVEVDGYLETFIGEGSNWSNVVPADEGVGSVLFTAEKQQASKYCCTGLYYWRSIGYFLDSYNNHIRQHDFYCESSEIYIAPIYNDAISRGGEIRYTVIKANEVFFSGTPAEYLDFLNDPFTW